MSASDIQKDRDGEKFNLYQVISALDLSIHQEIELHKLLYKAMVSQSFDSIEIEKFKKEHQIVNETINQEWIKWL